MTDEKKPLDHAMELVVYAPLGFALEARRLLPSFVERGRQQVTMAKVIGQFAVSHGQRTASKQLHRVQDQAGVLLGEFGLAPQDPEPVAEPVPQPDQPAAAPAASPRSGAGAADLPIADYDSLAASQVIPRLDGLSDDEVAAVLAYEQAHRGRKTILGKIAQLTGE